MSSLIVQEMKKIILHIIICIAFSLQSFAQITVDDGYISNQLYVKIIPPTAQSIEVQYIPHPDNPNLGKSAWDIIKNYGGMSMINAFSTNYEKLKNVYKVTLKQGSDINALVDALNINQDVEFAERIPVYSIEAKPVDLDESKQWYFKTINMNTSWNSVQINSERNKVIAVIDNGVNYKHEDLRGSIAVNTKEIDGDGIDNDKNGYIDDSAGWNVVSNTGDPSPHSLAPQFRDDPRFEKYGWHGTHVAGIIGASAGNNKGIASLGLNNRVLCIKASGIVNGKPDDLRLFNINEAFDYAIARKVDIINCSFGSPHKSIVTQEKINEAVSNGIVVVAGAGNSNSDAPFYPAAYENVIAVGATTRDDKVWTVNKKVGSNYGSFVDVMAPGHDIYSTASTYNNSYGYLSGTSMAAPMVSGLAGLILSMEPHRVDRIEEIIKGGCDIIDANNPNYINKMGAGRINVDRSFEYMLFMDNPASVLETSNYTDFNIYPNPTPKQFFIPFNAISQSGQPVIVKVLNTVGAEVVQQNISFQTQPIVVEQLSQGVYQIVVITAEGKNYRSRLMVGH